MKIVVCCKAVPVDIGAERVEVVNGDIHTTARELFINEVDEYALEAALVLKKSYDAEVWAVTVGSLMSQEALYTALAKNVDHVLRVDGETERPDTIAAKLVGALEAMAPDLVLTGVQSLDWMGGEVGVFVAEGLGMPVAYAVVEIVAVDEKSVRVIREIGGGRKAEMVLDLPAVLCVQSGVQTLQYVSAIKRRKVKGTFIDVWDKETAAAGSERIRAVRVSAPEDKKHAEMIAGERTVKVQKVLEIIRKNL